MSSKMYSGRFGNPGNKPLKPQNPSSSPHISNVEQKAINLEEKRKAMFNERKKANTPSSKNGWLWGSKGGRRTRRAHKNKKRTNKSRRHRR